MSSSSMLASWWTAPGSSRPGRSPCSQPSIASVTTARDLGARSFLDIAVRSAIASGMAEGPRLVTAARPLTPTGGHRWFMGGESDSVDDLRRMVRLHHKQGADFVKVMSTGGFMTEGAPPWSAQFSPAELETVVTEAHRLGKRAAAHAHGRQAGHHPGRDGGGGHHRALLIRRTRPQVRLGFRSGRGG